MILIINGIISLRRWPLNFSSILQINFNGVQAVKLIKWENNQQPSYWYFWGDSQFFHCTADSKFKFALECHTNQLHAQTIIKSIIFSITVGLKTAWETFASTWPKTFQGWFCFSKTKNLTTQNCTIQQEHCIFRDIILARHHHTHST